MVKLDWDNIKRLNLKRILKERHMKQKDLAELMGVSAARVSALLADPTKDGARNIGKKTISDLCEALRIDEEEFYRLDVVGVDTPEQKYGPIPVISWIQAGELDEVIDNHQVGVSGEGDPVYTSKPVSRSSFALIVEGDSMWPRFMEGDTIIIDPELEVRTGDFCVAKVDGNATFKRYYENENRIELRPLNEKWSIKTIMKDKPVDFRIIGKVVDMRPKI